MNIIPIGLLPHVNIQTLIQLYLELSVKALRKTDFSKFCNFAKIGTRSVPYFPKIQNLLRHNQIFGILQKNMEYSKPMFLGKNRGF